jgi:hypothetical protein
MHFECQRRERALPWHIGSAEDAPALACAHLRLPGPAGACELRLTAAGHVRVGYSLRDLTTSPIREPLHVVQTIRGTHALRLFELARARLRAPLPTHGEWLAAIGALLAEPPGLDHWLGVFQAVRAERREVAENAHEWSCLAGDPRRGLPPPAFRETVLAIMDDPAHDTRYAPARKAAATACSKHGGAAPTACRHS